MIYIITSDTITGGPELLHQCAYYINKNNPGSAKIFYVGNRNVKNFEYFSRYIEKDDIAEEIIDDFQNIVIAPETFTNYLRPYNNVQKVLWWLSVDNYFLNYGENVESLKGKVLMFLRRIKRRYVYKIDAYRYSELAKIKHHWFQSLYAEEFLGSKFGIKGNYVGDFLNKELLEPMNPQERKNIVLFNPKKGFEDTKKIIDYFKTDPELKNIEFIPLVGFDKKGLRDIFNIAKIYIDFGYHPGKDRMPREACVNGCIVITNKKGSASNTIDVKIPSKYKFTKLDKENLSLIGNLFLSIVNEFSSHQKDFEDYKNIIINEEKKFEYDLLKSLDKIYK